MSWGGLGCLGSGVATRSRVGRDSVMSIMSMSLVLSGLERPEDLVITLSSLGRYTLAEKSCQPLAESWKVS